MLGLSSRDEWLRYPFNISKLDLTARFSQHPPISHGLQGVTWISWPLPWTLQPCPSPTDSFLNNPDIFGYPPLFGPLASSLLHLVPSLPSPFFSPSLHMVQLSLVMNTLSFPTRAHWAFSSTIPSRNHVLSFPSHYFFNHPVAKLSELLKWVPLSKELLWIKLLIWLY